MRRFTYLLLFFLLGFTIGDVHVELVNIKWDNLNSGKNDNIIRFEDCSFDEKSGLPVYSKRIPVSGNSTYLITLENTSFAPLNSKNEMVENHNFPDEIAVKQSLLKSGSNRFLQVQFIPIIEKDDGILLLESFRFKIIQSIKISKNQNTGLAWKSSSVLKSGKWVKIKTSGKGLYKISYENLTTWGFTTPQNVKVFGSGGVQLSENPGEILYDDLEQNTVWHGTNNGEQCLFFYEPGNIKWELNFGNSSFVHIQNPFSDYGYYFLTEDVGQTKNIEVETVNETANFTSDFSNAYDLYEVDAENLIFSGKQWFGQKFIRGTTKTYSFDLKNIIPNSEFLVNVQAAGRSYLASEMPVTINSEAVGALNFLRVNTDDKVTQFADLRAKQFVKNTNSENVDVVLKYFSTSGNSGSDDNAEAWLDFIELNYKRKLVADNNPLFFRNIESVGASNISEFTISGVSAETKLFDVSNPNAIKEIPLERSGNTAKAKIRSNVLKELVVFNQNGNFKEAEWVSEIENQNLHAAETPEFLIITHPNFMNAANTLADFHRSYDGMSVLVANAEKVYNEFSSGAKNATGIRNYIKMFYDRNDGLKYVLLFGDGSYDNKKINAESHNLIPTYQSDESLFPTASFVSDDYFVILDDGESVYNGLVDLGIGRIPASTAYEAQVVVNKVLNYYNAETLGDWRNVVCFIGDDEDSNLHMRDSEVLANKVKASHKEFIIDKIYFDAYPQESIAGVERYPGVNEAINKRVKDGVLVLNYVGHANDRFLAEEHVLDISDINSWSNEHTLPIFVTATCEFSRFDADETSAGEYVLFNPNGGGIGLFSTTRVVYAGPNFQLSKEFYNVVFGKDENDEHYRMGDIIRLAKVNTIYGYRTNKRNFSLLADPALKLSYPENKVITSTINQHDAILVSDTVGALQKVTVSGYIADNHSNKLNNFNGEIIPIVFDKSMTMKTLGNAGETPMEFNVQENIIYKGRANVSNGEFTFSFVVPKDISYSLGSGKIVYYAHNGQIDANGAFENFVIGGNAKNQIVDNTGPDIQLFMDSENFVSGDETSKNPSLIAFLSDENGINTVGTGIGHDITAILDNDYSNVLVLNKYYQSNLNDYTSGVLIFPFKNLEVGKHTLRLKAWDVANNSSEVEIEFVVSGDFVISNVRNYPNPVTDYTFFTFEHNQSDAMLDVIVEIFDLSGKRIDFFTKEVGSNGLQSNPIRWDVTDYNGVLYSGIYIYRITAQNNDNVLASESGKFVVAH